MAWVLREILLEEWATEALIRRLETLNNVEVARYYGVGHSTVAHWRKRFHIPAFSQGNSHPSEVKAALLAAMQPGRWYAFSALLRVPGTRAQRYTMLHRLTQEGVLVRRGEAGAYIWQLVPRQRAARRAR